MEQAFVSPTRDRSAAEPGAAWLSTNYSHTRLPPLAISWAQSLDRLLQRAPTKRLNRETWVRYRMDLASYLLETAQESPATLTPVTAELVNELCRSPWRKQPQVRSAVTLWQHGLRSGYAWLQDEKPLCLQWLFSHSDSHLLQTLPEWGGMYPPLPPDWGQVENLLSLPAGMRYPGGAAAPFAHAMHRLAARQGLRWLITHIHERNAAAHRWAERTGWMAYGRIQRYQLDLPHLRRKYVYLHDTSLHGTAFQSRGQAR